MALPRTVTWLPALVSKATVGQGHYQWGRDGAGAADYTTPTSEACQAWRSEDKCQIPRMSQQMKCLIGT